MTLGPASLHLDCASISLPCIFIHYQKTSNRDMLYQCSKLRVHPAPGVHNSVARFTVLEPVHQAGGMLIPKFKYGSKKYCMVFNTHAPSVCLIFIYAVVFMLCLKKMVLLLLSLLLLTLYLKT